MYSPFLNNEGGIMIRLNYVVRRHPDLSREEFRRYWRDKHGPLVVRFQKELNLLRYVQSPAMDDPLGEAFRESRVGMEAPYDGHEDFWWEDRTGLSEMLSSEAGRAAMDTLIDDERKFIDLSQSAIWLSKEVPQVNPMPENGIMAEDRSTIIKLVYALTALPQLGRKECQRYWLMNHGYLARRYGRAMGFLRYIQSHTLDDPLNGEFQTARGSRAPYHGLTEVWVDRMELTQIMNTPDCEGGLGFGLLHEDEKKFVDFTGSTIWSAKEHVFIDR
jgi:hypothetical protein